MKDTKLKTCKFCRRGYYSKTGMCSTCRTEAMDLNEKLLKLEELSSVIGTTRYAGNTSYNIGAENYIHSLEERIRTLESTIDTIVELNRLERYDSEPCSDCGMHPEEGCSKDCRDGVYDYEKEA